LLLDFANLAPSDTLNVTHAVLEFQAQPDAPTVAARSIVITRFGSPDTLCKITLSTSPNLAPLECDVTAAVKSWLASAPGSARVLKISASGGASATASVATELAADGTQRPRLLVDYSASCNGKVCPALLQ
jgi:hypothetical protein